MPGDAPHLSVVIPAYNEGLRLPTMLETAMPYLRGCGYRIELVVVDDGSHDGTGEAARLFDGTGLAIRVLRNERNQGKGFSVRRGVLESRGRYIVFCDADGSTSLTTLDAYWPAVQAGARVVIGSRHLPASRIVRAQPWTRRQMSGTFRWLGNRILVHPVSDIMCGFKLFDAEAAQAIFSRLRLTQWAFDAELLFIAQHLGFRIAEVPVIWTNDDRSRVRLSVDSWQAFAGLIRIRLNAARGCYR